MNEFETVKGNIHIHIQSQGKRHLTIVEGLDADLDLKRICKCWPTFGQPTLTTSRRPTTKCELRAFNNC
jgi:hypothetical protein